jgi:Carboxypeptidase regulatory-like domain/Bacterial Ig-like domain (group 2)
VAILVACAGHDTQSPTAPTPTPAVSVSSVMVTSTSPSVGTFQLAANAHMSDGSARDVTSLSRWESSNTLLAVVSATGFLTVVGSGEVEVRATYQSVMGTMRILVSQPPTQTPTKFTILGVVHEVRPNDRVLANVRIEITAGRDAGMFTISDAAGFFRFDNMSPGVIAIQATKDGYERWQVSNFTLEHDQTSDVWLYPTPPTSSGGSAATARCNDGTWSWAQARGDTCSANGGIAYAVCPGVLCDGLLTPAVRRLRH